MIFPSCDFVTYEFSYVFNPCARRDFLRQFDNICSLLHARGVAEELLVQQLHRWLFLWFFLYGVFGREKRFVSFYYLWKKSLRLESNIFIFKYWKSKRSLYFLCHRMVRRFVHHYHYSWVSIGILSLTVSRCYFFNIFNLMLSKKKINIEFSFDFCIEFRVKRILI